MVLPLMDDLKTQSRRIMRVQPDLIFGDILDPHKWYAADHGAFCGDVDREIKPPHQPGDIVYAAEGTQIAKISIFLIRGVEGRYLADNEEFDFSLSEQSWRKFINRKKPLDPLNSRFMLHDLARTYLEILDVKAERIQDISPSDACDEGAISWALKQGPGYWKNSDKPYPVFAFQGLWNSIHGPDAWKDNKWVWAYKFKRCEKPQD